MKRTDIPSKGELVVVRIKRITGHGAFAELLEYPGKEGFIHISQISSSWVKNIRSHISEGQVRVALVTHVDPRKGIIDISLRSVKPNQEKRKINEWKREKKADKLLELIAKKLGTDLETAYRVAGWKLEDEYGEVYAAFEEMAIEGEKALEGIDIPDEWKKALVEHAKKYVEPPKIEIRGVMEITVPGKGGIDVIKKALKAIEGKGVQIVYQGAPKYFIKLESTDYKRAEGLLSEMLKSVEKEIKKVKGTFAFERIEE